MPLVQKEPKSIKIWSTDVSKVYLWATLVRPKIINFATQWPSPAWFHVPLMSEWNAVTSIFTNTFWLSSWDYIKTYLKMPYCWERNANNPNQIINQWWWWYYWSSVAYSNTHKYCLSIASGRIVENTLRSSYWCSVRPFKNEAVVPDSSWTVLYQWGWNAWIYHNSSLEIISISWDWTNWYTIADKNLWATTVYNSWDTLTANNCWWYFQRGNNYMYPFSWNVSASVGTTDASTYWPWNYYSSSTYLYGYTSRDSSNNLNLRWWVDGNVPVN